MILSAIALGVGAAKGLLGAANRWSERNDKIDELEKQKKQIETAQNNLTTNYNSERDAGRKVIANTVNNRDTTLNQTVSARAENDSLARMQMATIAVQASETEGQTVQQASQSGFRATGSNMNATENIQQEGKDAMTQAKAQVSLSRFSDFTEARNRYVSANQQIESYQDSMVQAENLYQQRMQAYADSIGDIDDNLDDVQGFWGTAGTLVGSVLDLAGGVLGGASGAVNMKDMGWSDVWGAVTA